MRILITGSNGFVAQKFCELWQHNQIEGVLLGVSKTANRNKDLPSSSFRQCDLIDLEALNDLLTAFRPTHILHTAALSSVESCVDNPDMAQRINVDLTTFLGEYATSHNAHLTFLSTDFVFDGIQGPYKEEDLTAPVNAYGESKVRAEESLLTLEGKIAILRTILVYGCISDSKRGNLVLWAKKQLEEGNPIRVVRDQWRMPTWVDDLAQACFLAMKKEAQGLFHISGSELYSIEEVVYQVADYWNLDKSLISSITAKDIGQDQNRPARTGFVLDKARTVLGFTPTPFVVSLQKIDEQLKQHNS
ncbi:SDR family oxidoreductase [Sphingobacterium yanglingense]|nr:SDR family oxidoreductase [Sphingobacterium yanglingense]